jgi:hypothetical protein
MFNTTISVENQKHKRGGRLKVKIYISVYGDNPQTVALRQMNFGAVKDH